jgi:hypothetical protein
VEEKTVRTFSYLDVFYVNYLLALDISADLQELTRCPVGLVSSGVKSILDIGRYVIKIGYLKWGILIVFIRTLEYLVSFMNSCICIE